MNDCYIVRRGGAGGALMAVSASSADNLTAYAPDGMLGIISSVSPGKVYATNEAPATPIHGDVWVQVGAGSAAPIQKGYITIYPTAARQYQHGEWVGVACYVRVQAAWVPLEMVLYRNGNLYQTVTGGWGGVTYSTASYNLEAVSNGVPVMEIAAAQNYDHTKTGAAALFTRNKLPVGSYNKLIVTFRKHDNNGRFAIGLSSNQLCREPEGKSTGLLYGEEDAWQTVELDLSGIAPSTEAYIKIYIHAPGNNDMERLHISDVYLSD